MATSQEIQGSRRTWKQGNQTFAEQLFVSDDGTTGLPALKSAFTGDTGITSRLCFHTEVRPHEPFPGLFYIVAHFGNFIVYA